MTLLAAVVDVARAVAATSARTGKIRLLADLLRQVDPGEIEAAVGFLVAAPRQGKLGVGFRTIADLAVPPADASTLTIADVDDAITRLADGGGVGSTAARQAEVAQLWSRATAPEQEFLAGVLLGEVRIGALAGVLTDAVAQAAGMPAEPVRRAVMLTGSLGQTAYLALTGTQADIDAVGLTVGVPVLPMLASTGATSAAALAAIGDGIPASVEVKLDGARIQIHRAGGLGSAVQVFTRNLADITTRVPEIVQVVSQFPGGSLILDGETLSLDEDGGPRPFQETMSRFGASTARAELLRPWFFDVLHADGVDLLDEPLRRRREVLAAIVGDYSIKAVETADAAVAEQFSRDALIAGHEGVLVKSLDAPYAAGRRGKHWIKVKPVHTYDLVVLAVEWGSGRRTGWLSNLHLGARNPAVPLGDPGDFVMVGKTFKGLTDATLAWQTERLLALETTRTRYAVHVRPELVVEIAIDGVQRSSRYPGGVALRFARVKGYREDKQPADADTIDTLRAMLR